MCQMEAQKKNKEESNSVKQVLDLGDRTVVTGVVDRLSSGSHRFASMDPIVRALCRAAKQEKQWDDLKEVEEYDEDDWEDERREAAWRRVFNENDTIENLRATKAARQHRREAEACARAAAATGDCFAPQWVGDVQLQFFIEL